MLEAYRFNMLEASRFNMLEGSRFNMLEGSRFNMLEASRFNMLEGSRFNMLEGSRFNMLEGSCFNMLEGSRFNMLEAYHITLDKSKALPLISRLAEMKASPEKQTPFVSIGSFVENLELYGTPTIVKRDPTCNFMEIFVSLGLWFCMLDAIDVFAQICTACHKGPQGATRGHKGLQEPGRGQMGLQGLQGPWKA
jgi:hypothetical protein